MIPLLTPAGLLRHRGRRPGVERAGGRSIYARPPAVSTLRCTLHCHAWGDAACGPAPALPKMRSLLPARAALPLDTAPLACALAAAVLFAVGDQFQGRGVRELDSRSGTLVSVVTSTACLWLLAPLLLHPDALASAGILIFALTRVFRPASSATITVPVARQIGRASWRERGRTHG